MLLLIKKNVGRINIGSNFLVTVLFFKKINMI